jgi:hypothetical protein
MRAKFVKAELLYPSATQQQVADGSQQMNPSYGTVDYSAFSQPPVGIAASAFSNQEQASNIEMEKMMSTFDSEFHIQSTIDSNQFNDESNNNVFLNHFNFNDNGDAQEIENQNQAKVDQSESETKQGVSKFGFGYEELSENLSELELTTSSKELIEMFSQAKYQIEMGNIEDGNQILNEMMSNNEIRYKEFSNIDQHIMSSFTPISE